MTTSSSSPLSNETEAVHALYQQLLAGWNNRRADEMAAVMAEDGIVIGFDGSQMNGRAEVQATLSQIFADHQTSAYVSKIREIRFLAPEVAILRAVAGMVPPGQSKLNPAVNTIQTLVAVKQSQQWLIALYQNTPAQFHGRPDLAQQLTEELQRLL